VTTTHQLGRRGDEGRQTGWTRSGWLRLPASSERSQAAPSVAVLPEAEIVNIPSGTYVRCVEPLARLATVPARFVSACCNPRRTPVDGSIA
jgi:hypothetical protein